MRSGFNTGTTHLGQVFGVAPCAIAPDLSSINGDATLSGGPPREANPRTMMPQVPPMGRRLILVGVLNAVVWVGPKGLPLGLSRF